MKAANGAELWWLASVELSSGSLIKIRTVATDPRTG